MHAIHSVHLPPFTGHSHAAETHSRGLDALADAPVGVLRNLEGGYRSVACGMAPALLPSMVLPSQLYCPSPSDSAPSSSL